MDAQQRFESLVDALMSEEGVTPPGEGQGFGAGALKADNKIFAMLANGRLVVKLPRLRVDEIVAASDGKQFDAGKGKPMKEWLELDPASPLDWLALGREALTFVRGH